MILLRAEAHGFFATMSFTIYIVTTAALFFAVLVLLRRLYGAGLRLSERIALAACGVMGWTVLVCLALGTFGAWYTRGAVLAADALALPALWILRLDLAEELRAALARVREVASRHRAWLVPPLVAFAFWCSSLAYSFVAPFPGVDAFQYHLPIATMIVQEKRLGLYETRAGHVNEFPRNGQMNSARMLVYGCDERPLRAVQWTFGIIAVLAIYAAMRHLGVGGRLAGTFASLFWFMPAVYNQPFRLWGTVDLIFHALFLVALALVLAPMRDRATLVKRSLAAAFVCGLAMGTRSQGLLFSAVLMTALFFRIALLSERAAPLVARLRSGVAPALKFAAPAVALLLLFGSYTFALNWKHFDNPVHPIEVKLGDRVLFEGPYDSVAQLVGTHDFTGTKNAKKALRRSLAVLWNSDWVFEEKRLGGWGLAFVFALLPALPLGAALCAYRRAWFAALVALGTLLHLYLAPDAWWSRFMLYAFGVGLVMVAVLAEWLSRWRLALPLAVWVGGLSVASGAEGAYCFASHEYRGPYRAAGPFLHSADVYRPYGFWETKDDADLYVWVRANMREDDTLVYFHPYWGGIYHYLFYRDDFRNRVYGLGKAKDIAELRALLAERGATCFIAQHYPDAVIGDFAHEAGTEVARFGKYAVYRIDPAAR